jgi:hypothetical protein
MVSTSGTRITLVLLISAIMALCLSSTSWAKTEKEYEEMLGRCAVVVEAEKQGVAEPKTCYQCYWIAESASVNMVSRDGKFMAKQIMSSLEKYKNY